MIVVATMQLLCKEKGLRNLKKKLYFSIFVVVAIVITELLLCIALKTCNADNQSKSIFNSSFFNN